MATGTIEVSERVLTDSRKRPTKALAEAIWNALDVGADHVDVELEFTEPDAVKTIIVVDDGERHEPRTSPPRVRLIRRLLEAPD